MAESFEVFRRFEYRANSNLVLQREGPGPGQNEPTGEPESLRGRIKYRMGDSVQRALPPVLQSSVGKKRGREEEVGGVFIDYGTEMVGKGRRGGRPKRLRAMQERKRVKSVLLDDDIGGDMLIGQSSSQYQPTTPANERAYQVLLDALVGLVGEQEHSVLVDSASETLLISRMSGGEAAKRKLLEQTLGTPLTDTEFTKLLQAALAVTDYKGETETGDRQLDDADISTSGTGDTAPTGVAVVFDAGEDAESDNEGLVVEAVDDEDEEDYDEDEEEEDEENNNGELSGNTYDENEMHVGEGDEEVRALGGGDNTTMTGLSKRAMSIQEHHQKSMGSSGELAASKIDAHWLQRELRDRNVIGGMEMASKVIDMEKEILSILPLKDLHMAENKLISTLGYDQFDFIRTLLANRWKVYFVTRLRQAQNEVQRRDIEKEMEEQEEGRNVLSQLTAEAARADKEKAFAASVRAEASVLAAREEKTGDNVKAAAARWKLQQRTIDNEEGNTAENLDELEEDIEPEARQPISKLNLSELVLANTLQSRETTRLPEGTTRIQMTNYDEVVIPPPTKEPSRSGTSERLNIRQVLPEWAQEVFTSVGMTHLNLVQSKVFEAAFKGGGDESPGADPHNMLVCAPTGAGKTNVALLAILNVMNRYKIELSDGNVAFDFKQFKIVYVSPMKALVSEQVSAFSKRLSCIKGMHVRELTGDVNLSRQQIEDTQIIVTTPEKWDVITRRSGERAYTQLVRLMIVDEIHLLHDARGAVVETLIARMLRQTETSQQPVRLIGLSATLPNFADVAAFLRVKPDKGLFYFGNHFRPVPLKQTFIGMRVKKAIRRYNTMNRVAYERMLDSISSGHQVLIFVHSRKETLKTARWLRDTAMTEETLMKILSPDSPSRAVLQHVADTEVQMASLKEILPYGFAIHHAGMNKEHRKTVEDLFADSHVRVLVSTATLAWGVNLPAHTVIIKGTRVYNPSKGGWEELSPLDVTQMMGRAGRPGYDTEGHGVIITDQTHMQFYLSLNNQQLPIESQLIAQLPEMLNAEIVLGTISSRKDGVKWLAYTYLYVRMLRAPQLYGISDEVIAAQTDPKCIQRRIDLVHSALLILERHRLINYDRRSGYIQVTALGRIAAHYYLQHPTVAILNANLSPQMTDIDLLRVVSLANEFAAIPVREEEKLELARLVEKVPIPVKGHLGETACKVNVLLQAYISRLKLEGFALMADLALVQQSIPRLMRAIFEIALRRKWTTVAQLALEYSKVVERRMWNTQCPLRQFDWSKVKNAEGILRSIEKKDVPWDKYALMTPQQLNEVFKNSSVSREVHRKIHQIPRLEVTAFVQPVNRKFLRLELLVQPDFEWNNQIHKGSEVFWVFIEDVDGERLLHYESFSITHKLMDQELTIDFVVPIDDPPSPNYFVRVISDKWLASQTDLAVSFRDLILPAKNRPHTELLELQPLPIRALEFPEAEALYNNMPEFADKQHCFNAIQTQVFGAFYKSDDNVLLCAASSSGHVVCMEFAILRLIQTDQQPKIVYIAPFKEVAESRYEFWKERFEERFGLSVCLLAGGDMATDFKLFQKSHLTICTPEKWDAISRRWKTRKAVQKVKLLLLDELQLLTDPIIGSSLEVCVARTRYISAAQNTNTRIVGCAMPLADGQDIADWMGITKPQSFFSFNPNVRATPVEVALTRFDLNHRLTRLVSMYKPMFQAIMLNAKPRQSQVIVFSPDRREARLVAVELLLLAAAEGDAAMFRKMTPKGMQMEIEEALGNTSMREKALADLLPWGVGLIHEGMRRVERELVLKLFKDGKLQLVVVTGNLCWGISAVTAPVVLIQDTERWDAKKRKWAHYPVTDVLKFVSRAGGGGATSQDSAVSTGNSQCCYVNLYCHSSKREEYKNSLFESLTVESNLDVYFADHLLGEIATGTIKSTQDAIDWLTWTFMYRRLPKNPNYYGLKGASVDNLSQHLSELVENAITSLANARCIALENNDTEFSPLNLGLIATFYHLQYNTIETFNKLVSARSRRRDLLEILVAASEIDMSLTIRAGEDVGLRMLHEKMGMGTTITEGDFETSRVKALILLMAHFNRVDVSLDFQMDTHELLGLCVRLVQGLVDVMTSNGWLYPAISSMTLSQMLVQGCLTTDSPLLQLPNTDANFVKLCEEKNIRDVFDLINAEDDTRSEIFTQLKLSEFQISNIAEACNSFPVVSIEYSLIQDADKNGEEEEIKGEIVNSDKLIKANDGSDIELARMKVFKVPKHKSFSMKVSIVRDLGQDEEGDAENIAIATTVRPAVTPRFPFVKDLEWWIVVGEPVSGEVVVIKRVALNKVSTTLTLELNEILNENDKLKQDELTLVLYLIADSYIGCDQEYVFQIIQPS